ncbi:PepSY domain-containing protein [Roseibium sediminis]|uniref:PepSY domain-containing protein n=1 Tax=Roseibium sediminis TaxID=1775174 RepID=UPI00123D9EA5|nr:PepSY domain-containing protein [Roseibium sediminis]
MKTIRNILIATSLTAIGVSGIGAALADSKDNGPIDPSKASISIQQASDIALGEVSGTVTEIELENERGVLVYDVEVASATGEVELQIDAASGQILAKKLDDDKHDDDDDDRDGKDN